MEDNLIKRLMLSIKCTVCNRPYEESRVSVLGHRKELWFLTASCTACGTSCLVAVALEEGSAPQPVSDLSKQEAISFRHKKALNANEILDMHRFLKDFDGDFNRLFENGLDEAVS
jgi:hypothetical protein